MSSNHPVITPQFLGTSDEIIAALNYWTTLVGHLRQLTTVVTDPTNIACILEQLERELDILKATTTNASATVDTSQPGAELTQPVKGNDELSGEPEVVSLEVPSYNQAMKPQTIGSLIDRYNAER